MGDDKITPPSGEQPSSDWPGEKEGKVSGSGSGERSYEYKGESKNVGVGDKKPEADADEAKREVKTDIGIKPLYSKQFAEASLASTQEGEEDQTFASAVTGKASMEAIGAAYNVEEQKGKATLVNAKAEGSLAHGQADLIGILSNWLFGRKMPELPPPPPAPMAARFMDLTTHGTPLAPGPGSPNVRIGSMPAWRATIDQSVCAAPGAAPHGAGPAMKGEPSVLINSMPAIRVGDWVVEPTGGPNVIVMGCPTVHIGSPAGAAPKAKPPEPKPEDLPFVLVESVAQADIGAAEATAKVEGEVDFKQGKGAVGVELGAVAAGAKASLPLKIRFRIPFTGYFLGLGVTAEGTLGSAGAEAVLGAKINDGKTLFAAKVGAGAHVGVGGLAAKFSVDVAKK